jgi:enamine deaminase RidA (YjgF/YER057c/UK114 family)
MTAFVSKTDTTAKTSMPEKQFLNHSYTAKPNGYSHVVTSPPGKMIFLSGAGGTDQAGNMPKDFASQADNTFKHLQNGLEMACASFKDVVKINYVLKDMNDLTELRKVRAKYLNMEKPPAATAVQTGLSGEMLLEVELVAIVPE